MAYFPTLTTDLDNIQKLDDLPNQTGGLSADELKAKFDKAGDDIKAYINSTLLAALEATTASASGAGGIGIEDRAELNHVTNVLDALLYVIGQYNTGTVGANSVFTAAIQDGAVTTVKLDDGAVTTPKLNDGAVTPAKTDFTSAALTVGAAAVPFNISGPIILTSANYGSTEPLSPSQGQLFLKEVQ